MGKMSCFSGLLSCKKKALEGKNKGAYAKKASGNDCPKVKPVEFMDMVVADAVVDDVSRCRDSVPASACSSRLVVVAHAAAELARDATGENGDKAAAKRDSSSAAGSSSSGYSSDGTGDDAKSAEPDDGEPCSLGRLSPTAASPKLMRSCSNIETTRSVLTGSDLPAKSRSYDDLKTLPHHGSSSARIGGAVRASPTPASSRTSCSADRVMLKKRSSRQVLPSRSRKLWWQLFLWSHRNVHRRRGASAPTPTTLLWPSPGREGGGAAHRRDGYASDTLGTATADDAKEKGVAVEEEGPRVPTQWVAFSAEASPLDRVSAWVNSLGNGSFHAVDEDGGATGHGGDGASRPRPRRSEIVQLPTSAAGGRRHPQPQAKRRAAEAGQASSIIVQTLNTFSSVAHIAGMGLQAVPAIAAFSTLRAVNLSGNVIVRITAGSLPKGLHSLDLSRNKIAIIEGLRDLTRLRVLNLSYNRISRIGHGLSSCTAIRELYLAGNKIGDVEGLHRLLKLAVLDVSFNKIGTAKSLGQLVANYGSLRAINLLGNPVQANAGDDTLRRAVSGLLPRIEYLNKQAVKPQRAREVAKDSVAQAALGNAAGANSRRRPARRLGQSPAGSSAAKGRRGSRSRSVTRPQSSSLPLPRR
ncbi:Dynein assembly factor 1, axonemal [Zea mays]|uniref:Dynein assembly factor 1, axonemal n=1 Tax=Zea mays TaxID=4577 RepID=A0A317Y802_MAIZE|nr:Dynein assembly factor 1, axonemal [Zea mays]